MDDILIGLNEKSELTLSKEKRIFKILELAVERHRRGDLKEAFFLYGEVRKLDPNNVVAIQLCGVLASQIKDYDLALDFFSTALEINPDYVDALFNRGIIFKQLRNFDQALSDFGQALNLNSDHLGALNSRGNTLRELNRFEEAIDDYQKAIMIRPNYGPAIDGLVTLLVGYTPQRKIKNPILKANQSIRKIDTNEFFTNPISDFQVVEMVKRCSQIIEKHCKDLKLDRSQIYRRNAVDMKCARHMSIFERYNIIPEFCFGCFKVQVEPRSILEQIKLFIVFDRLVLVNNNTRKCMVELRPNMPGFYKGLIYCSSSEEAKTVLKNVDTILQRKMGTSLPAKIKRGCSEYSISFPEFEETDNLGMPIMHYNKDWKNIESTHDKKYPSANDTKIALTSPGISLNDALIIQNWINYSHIIGDKTNDIFEMDSVSSKVITEQASRRLKNYTFI